MRPLSFLHIATFYPPYSFGGDATYLYRLCHALGDEGHHVEVIHCVDAYHLAHPAEPEIKVREHPRVRRHELRSGHRLLSTLVTQQTGRSFMKAERIREVMNSRHFDVVHYHNTSLIGPEALTINPDRGRPIKMYTAHEHWLVCPMHVLWKYNSRPCEKPECIRCTIHGRRPPQLWRYTGLMTEAAQHVDQFVAPSRFTANKHAERGFSQPVEHLPYFLDRVDRDWQSPGPAPTERPYFLFVGRLERIKGLQTLIDLWDRVPAGIDLLVAGAGTYEEQLRSQATGNSRVRFLGPQSQDQLGALYTHANAVIVPSITFETFGIVIIEAFARKTPVLVRDLGALPEVVDDSGGGFVYRNDDELLEMIQRMSSSPTLRNDLGAKGYAAFLRYWCRDAHLKKYFSYLRRHAISAFGCVPWERESVGSDSVLAR